MKKLLKNKQEIIIWYEIIDKKEKVYQKDYDPIIISKSKTRTFKMDLNRLYKKYKNK